MRGREQKMPKSLTLLANQFKFTPLGLTFSLIVVCILSWPGQAQAQIVNVLTPRIGDTESASTLVGNADANLREGNIVARQLHSSIGFSQFNDPHEVKVMLSQGYSRWGYKLGDLKYEKYFAHARYTYRFYDPFSFFVFVQGDKNSARRLNLRFVSGGGPQVRLWRADWTEAHLGVAAMYEREDIAREYYENDCRHYGPYPENETALPSTKSNRCEHGRLSAFFLLAVELSDNLTFSNTSFYQPSFDNHEDFRFYDDAALVVKASSIVSMYIKSSVMYDSIPPKPVNPLVTSRLEKTDTNVSAGLSFKFESVPFVELVAGQAPPPEVEAPVVEAAPAVEAPTEATDNPEEEAATEEETTESEGGE
jgi:Protein of unknown function, DUF481